MYFGHLDRLGVRLAVLFSGIFAVSAVVSFTVLFALLSRQLKQNDQSIIAAKWKEYESILQTSGLAPLKELIARERMQEGDVPLLVQVIGAGGATLFLKVPEDSSQALPAISASLARVAPTPGWADIPSPHDADRIDLLTGSLSGGDLTLRVGKSSDPRDDLMEKLGRLFLGISLLFVALGSALGMFFSSRALAPLRGLISTMNQVRSGSLSSRVPSLGGAGEMAELSAIFNQMLDRVESSVKGMHETLDNVAHDIRTPMARIRASAEMSLREPPGPQDRAALEDCAENADSVVSVLSSLLNLADAEAGSAVLRKELTPVSEIVNPVVDLYEIVAEEKAIRVCYVSSGEPAVFVDRARLKQALGNVLDNALKYSPSGTEIHITVEQLADAVLIHVDDQGTGIRDEDLPRIWERLYRADKSRSTPGMGIGLSLVRAFLRLHGGEAYAENRAGAGARFTLRIPGSYNVP